MTRTFYIDESRKGAKELLAYLRSLEFVIEENEDLITEEQYQILEQRRMNHLSGKSKTYSLEEVVSTIRSKKK